MRRLRNTIEMALSHMVPELDSQRLAQHLVGAIVDSIMIGAGDDLSTIPLHTRIKDQCGDRFELYDFEGRRAWSMVGRSFDLTAPAFPAIVEEWGDER